MRPNLRALVPFSLAVALVASTSSVAASPREAESPPDDRAAERRAAETPAGGDPAAVVVATGDTAPSPVPAVAPAAPPAPAPPRDPVVADPPARRVANVPVEVEVHGRIYMGIGADERDAWSRELGMREARIELQARLPRILTVIEADLSSRELLKDAFLRVDAPASVRIQAGRFKAPFSARRLESSWRLPLVGRGLVNDYVVERNGLGGRRLGATAAVRPWEGRLEVVGGAFVGTTDPDGGEERTADDLAARISGRPFPFLEAGGTAYRAARDEEPAREAATAYLALDLGRLETTVEGMTGSLRQGRFVAGTALASFTIRAGPTLRVAPMAGAEALELRGDVAGRGHAAILGAVLSWGDGLKVKVQGERARRPGDEGIAHDVALEIATRF